MTPWTVARQASLSTGFSRQEYWSGLPCPPPGGLPHPGIESMSLMSFALAGGFLTTEPPGKPYSGVRLCKAPSSCSLKMRAFYYKKRSLRLFCRRLPLCVIMAAAGNRQRPLPPRSWGGLVPQSWTHCQPGDPSLRPSLERHGWSPAGKGVVSHIEGTRLSRSRETRRASGGPAGGRLGQGVPC